VGCDEQDGAVSAVSLRREVRMAGWRAGWLTGSVG